jgi:hypothetical protein
MKKSHLSRSNNREKLFAVETLEQRILLSADPVVAELVQQYHNANADNLGALQVSASAGTENNLLQQQSQENAALNLDLANAKTQDFSLNTINIADFSNFQNATGQIVIGNENSNAIITLGDAKTNDGKLAFNQDLLISNPQNGGEIFVDDDLIGGENADLTINGSGHTTILSADISTAVGSNVTINDSLKISGTRKIESGGSIQLGSASNHFMDANSNGADSLMLTTATTGNVVVKGVVGGDTTNKLKSLTIGSAGTKTFNVSFDGEVTIDGDVTIYASGTVTFKSALTITNNGSLTIMGADLIDFENNVAVAGNIFLEGNEITLNGGQESVRTTGTGKTLTMRPTSTAYDISIGSPPAENTQNTLNITSTELFTLREGFSKIVIGNVDAVTGHSASVTSSVYLGSKAANQNTFFDAVEIYGKTIQIDDFFNPDFKFQTKSTLKLDAINDITIKNEVKAYNSSTNLNQNVTIYSESGNVKQVVNDGDALLRESITAAILTVDVSTETDLGFVNAASISITNDSPTGNIILNSSAATTVPTTITALTPRTSGNITLSSDVNSLTLSTALTTTTGNISVKAGLLTTANTISSVANGALIISQAVSTTAGTITLEAYSDLTLNAAVSTTGSSALSFKSTMGKILQNVDITSSAGSAISLTAGDNIEMLDAKTISTIGTITLTAGNNVKLSILNSTTTVNVTATNGAISDNLTVETPNILGTTTAATLTAKTGIGGAGTSDINTTIDNLTATNGAAGGIFINETDALRIAGNGVKQDGGTGSIVITNASDDIITVDGDVNNTGSGHILIKAQDTLTLNKLVKSATGNISLLSDTNSILLSASGGVETTGTSSSIDIDAALAITMAGGSSIKAGGGNVRLNARAGNIALSYLDAKTGKVSLLTTNAYRILDNDASDDIDVIASGLRMNTYSVGQDSSGVINTIEIDTTALSVFTTGSIFLTEATGLTVKTVDAITVKRVSVDGATLTDQIDAAQSDLTTTSNGAIVLTATTGDIVIQEGNANNQGVLANGSGNILINAITGNLRIEAPINSGMGHINLLSGATLTQTAEGDVTSASGTIDVNAATAIVMADGAATQTINQAIRYKAGSGDMTLGYLSTYGDGSSNGDIAIIAGGKIIDADAVGLVDTTGIDIRSKALYLSAVGIGSGENSLEIKVETLAAKADSGGLFLSQSSAITVDKVSAKVFRVGIDGSTLTEQIESGSDLTTTGNGAIVLSATDIVLNDGDTNGKAVSGQGSGNILLNATAGGLTFYGALSSTSGNVSLLATKDVLLNSATQITTGFPAIAATLGNPSIDIQAEQLITMINGSQVQTGNGNIRLVANGGNLTLGTVSAGIGNVSLISGGKILDSNETAVDIIAKNLRIYATDVGVNINPLELTVTTLSAQIYGNSGFFATETDGITISKIDDLTVNRVDTKAAISNKTDLTQSDFVSLGKNGSLILSTLAGSITVLDGNDDGKGIEIKNGGQILLNAKDTIDLEANVFANQGNISLYSTTRIVQTTNADVVTGGTIDYTAQTTITIEDDAVISTQGANIRLFATDTISFSGIDARGGDVSLIAKTLLDSGDTNLDVIAKNLRINTIFGAGLSKNALDINVENLSAVASTGGLYIKETDGLTVTKLPDIAIKRVSMIAEVSDIADAAQSNLMTTTGTIVLTTIAGDINVLEGKSDRKGIVTQSGNVLLNAAGNITLQAAIENLSAPIQLISGATLTQLENGYLLGGNTIDVAAKDTIMMNAGALTKTINNNDIRYKTTTGDMTIGLIDAGKGHVALLSGAKILDNFKSGLTTASVIASAANLTAENAIGTGGENVNSFDINVIKLTAKTGAGGAFISNAQALTVDSVSVDVQKIDALGISTLDDILSSSDLISSNNGSIMLTAPQITLKDGDTNNNAITLNGTGNLLLNATTVGIEISSSISVTSGNISFSALNGSSNILLNADISTSGSGTIDLNASGDIVMAKGTKLKADSNMRFNAGATITLANLNTLESVSLISDKILNGDGGNTVSANALRIKANSLATSDKPLATIIKDFSANLADGNLFLNAENALKITQISDVKVNRVQNNGSIVPVVDKKQSDVVVEKGAVIITTKSGDITVIDGDTDGKGVVAKQGSILLSAAENLNIQANIENTAGSIGLTTAALLTQSAKGNVISHNGTIDVNATKGIVMADGASATTSDQNIRYQSGGDINLSSLNSGKGNVVIISSTTISNASTTDKSNVIADSLHIAAKTIGSAGVPINVTLNKIASAVGSGGFFMSSVGDLTVDQIDEISINQVKLNSVVGTIKTDILRGIKTSDNGSVVLSAANLNINNFNVNNAIQKDNGIAANGTGNVLLTAKGNINLLSSVTTQKGAVTLIASNNITQNAKGNIMASSNGSLSLQAKDIIQAQSAKTQTVNGNIRLNADSITLGLVNAGKGNVSLLANKQIVDTDKTISITANQLRIKALAAGLGKNLLDVKVNLLSAEVGKGGLFINTTSKLVLSETAEMPFDLVGNTGETQNIIDEKQTGIVSTDNGAIIISASSNLTVSTNVNATGNLLLESRAGILNIATNVQSEKGAMSLFAGKDITVGNIQISNAQGTIDIRSKKNLLMSDGATIQTQDEMIALNAKYKLQVTGINAGDAFVSLIADSIVDAGDKNTDVTAQNLYLNGLNGVGTRSNALDINVDNFSATLAQNTLFVNELNTLKITQTPAMSLARIAANGTESKVTDSVKKGIVLSKNAAISILATSDITIDSPVKSPAGGNILLQSATGTIFQNAAIETSGKLKLFAPNGVVTKSASLAKIIAPLNSDSPTLTPSTPPPFYAWTESLNV